MPGYSRHPADELRGLLGSAPKSACALLMPFTVIDADFDGGFVQLEFAPQPAFRNPFGNVQGGFAVAMLDTVLAIAAFVRLRQWLPTVEIKSSFLEPVPIDTCIGEGRVLKAGRRLAFVEARLMTLDRRTAVTATATAIIPSPQATAAE